MKSPFVPIRLTDPSIYSSGWLPVLSAYKQENTTQDFLALLNVTTIAGAQALSSEEVIAGNSAQIIASPYGGYTYGPVVDGIFVPANPGVLLSAGAFAHDVKVMAGHNTNEGVLFTNPDVRTDAQLEGYITTNYPGIAPQIMQEIVNTLYPAVYDGSMPYTNGLERTIFLVTESIFTCNTNQLARALGNQTYAYQFEVPPALHGFDIGYTFWNGQPTNVSTVPPLIAPLAQVLQGYITNFAMTGNPNGKGLPNFPMYGTGSVEVGLNVTINSRMRDPTENQRCVFWGKALLD
jgi:carboxylesterase type B